MRVFEGVKASDKTELNNALSLFKYPIKINKDKNNNIKSPEIGCMISHLKLYKHIIDNNINICTIFEDDVHFHPNWHTLAPKFFNNTPKNFDVIFIGNRIKNYNNSPKINTDSSVALHAYIITLVGAKRLLNSILNWDYHNFKLNGLHIIDVIIKNIQNRINGGKIKRLFTWYCWNATKFACKYNKLQYKRRKCNCGLVFQSESFISSISQTNYGNPRVTPSAEWGMRTSWSTYSGILGPVVI